jgi:exodeoxyribonuclease-1
LKEVHLNRCPALVAWDHLREPDLQRLGIDPTIVEQRAARLREAGPVLAEKVRRVFADDRERSPSDADASLYDGFIGDGDKRLCGEVRATPPQALAARPFAFRDARLQALLFRYRARNWPDVLDADDRQRWNDYRRQRLCADSGLSEYSFDAFRAELQLQRELHAGNSAKLALLGQLEAWGNEIEASLR